MGHVGGWIDGSLIAYLPLKETGVAIAVCKTHSCNFLILESMHRL